MRDRWAVASFLAGLTAFCAVGLLTGHHLATVGILVAVLVGGVATAVAVRAVRHRRLVRGLRALSTPGEFDGVRLRVGELGDAAFVAGLSRPTIFCDRRLPERLSPAELRAVLLHERAHQLALDPARLLLVELVAPLARRSSIGRQWLANVIARREIAADRHALAHGVKREDLASALLRLPPLARAHVAGFTPAVDLRLRALLGEADAPTAPASVRRTALLVTGGIVGAGACAWFLHAWLSTAFGIVCC